eukprot:UN31358
MIKLGSNAYSKWKPKDEKKDTVYLHGSGRFRKAPDGSPFVVKLETYMRVKGIKYEYVNDGPGSRAGKKPWIYYNGKKIEDSHMIVKFFEKEFGSLDEELTLEQKSLNQAVRRMLEEATYWSMVYDRWWLGNNWRLFLIDILETVTMSDYRYMFTYMPGIIRGGVYNTLFHQG